MPNINKVVYGNTTLIDLTDSTLNSADQLLQGVTAYDRSGTKITGTATGGGTAAISIVDTPDAAGGDVRTITALDISDTTATASDVAQGKYFYTANGTKTAGAAVAPTPRTSSDLTVSGATVTAPAGLYASAASKSVSSMTLPTGVSATATGTKKATITQNADGARYLNIPTGYNATAQYYELPQFPVGSKTITANGTYNSFALDELVGYSSVTVAVPFSTIYSGSSAPSSAQGVNGDIYIQT